MELCDSAVSSKFYHMLFSLLLSLACLMNLSSVEFFSTLIIHLHIVSH